MKGTPSGQVLTPQDMQNSVVEDLDFEQIKTSVNEYLLENGVCIKLRLMLTRVGKTNHFNADGTPLYAVNNQIVPEIKAPSNFQKAKSIGVTRTPVV